MDFNLDQMSATDRYELLLGTVVPRPIALITTLDVDGKLNAAPYSLFNVMGHEPPVVAVSVLPHPTGRLKDTGANILATEEFVVNLVPEEMAEAMNISCIDAPAGYDELKLAKLAIAPSRRVKPPRIAASPWRSNVACSLHYRSGQTKRSLSGGLCRRMSRMSLCLMPRAL